MISKILIKAVKTPIQIQTDREAYAHENEDRALNSLIDQFNGAMIRRKPNQKFYDVTLYLERPAGFYDTINVRDRFVAHLLKAGWNVHRTALQECQLYIVVSPL